MGFQDGFQIRVWDPNDIYIYIYIHIYIGCVQIGGPEYIYIYIDPKILPKSKVWAGGGASQDTWLSLAVCIVLQYLMPCGSRPYSTPWVGDLILYIKETRHKVRYPKKEVWCPSLGAH